jgi:glycosyltransferase involved in cell wall biosynthesis
VKVGFLYLTAFGQTGGIEKFNRIFLKALAETSSEKLITIKAFSCYDSKPNPDYFPTNLFRGFGSNKVAFTIMSVFLVAKMDVIIIGHINLALIGLIIKLLYPSKKMILITHGIEVWNIHSLIKKIFLKKVDQILTVSEYTKKKIQLLPSVNINKIEVFHNTLDPYFSIPVHFDKPAHLLERYGLSSQDKIILTVARLSGTELHKGYDKVISVMQEILKIVPEAKYVMCGKYSQEEKDRIYKLIEDYRLQGKVILTGFVPDQELTEHYLLANLFIMPSKKEGFGIVFIEALACGVPVIAGNQDGSAEALLNGKLGTLVNPDSSLEIQQAIIQQLKQKKVNKTELQQEVLNHFGYKVYKNRVKEVLF